ncbi:hypothetical protein HPP92_029045 [Vanilla planifolia]|uniref:Uncharacterized protein n=1 Tax=Vanilla planifolia TaxID=51239 RepID=A0A835U1J2_VANPL|nr:hypothetical protein HPP92_029045 [Vanilla planifolia]
MGEGFQALRDLQKLVGVEPRQLFIWKAVLRAKKEDLHSIRLALIEQSPQARGKHPSPGLAIRPIPGSNIGHLEAKLVLDQT